MTKNMSNDWRTGFGVIEHSAATIARTDEFFAKRQYWQGFTDSAQAETLIVAADRLANAAMWLTAHMTYASRVDMSGTDLPADAFKRNPEGHTGGALNVAIGFVGYLLANALSGHTRAWTLGQGHCVAAIEAINTLTGDLSPAQIGRYERSETGLSHLVSDFYSYAMSADGRPAVPLGSHVGPNTAGGVSEGGYLGFSELQYIHMPLPGERLVAFLSDGAFEEQRGSDWSPRWWRAEDSGLAVPIMVLNGRRIEQRTEIGQEGGAEWFEAHLRLAGYDPMLIDGHDPLAYAMAILEAEERLSRFIRSKQAYPAPLPYIIARCTKGFGFPGAGTNRSHNLPLSGNPSDNAAARAEFHEGARKLFVPADTLETAVNALAVHDQQSRPRESQNSLARRNVDLPSLPVPDWTDVNSQRERCAMDAIDEYFVDIVRANPKLRPRIGNPDELRSNHMPRALELLHHRVNIPENGTPEAVGGAVITALNEEAVISAALGNKGGINIAVSYEAFGMKMLGALRQEIIFSRRQHELLQPPGWISVPLIATSHTWENAKNEQSHQDPTLPEALLGEMSDISRVIFPVDPNSAVAALRAVYRTHGQIACLVTAKRDVPILFSGEQAEFAMAKGAIQFEGDATNAQVQLVAIGAYQLQQARQARERLDQRGINCSITVILEPGRFREARDEIEWKYAVLDKDLHVLFPTNLPRIIISHTRPEPTLGLLRRLDGGPSQTKALGYLSRGGTLDVFGMLFANRCTWAHAVASAAGLLKIDRGSLLSQEELDAVDEQGDPQILRRDTSGSKNEEKIP